MEKILTFTFFCLLYSLVASDTTDVSFYNIMTNTSTKHCSELGHIGPNQLNVTYTGRTNSTSFTIPVSNELTGVSAVAVDITGSSNQFTVDVNVTAAGMSKSKSWKAQVSTGSFRQDFTNSNFSNLFLRTVNFSTSGNTSQTCLDLAVAYNLGNSIRNITAVSMGCWKFNQTLFSVDKTTDVSSWVNTLNDQICSGVLSNIRITPLIALVLACLASILNKL